MKDDLFEAYQPNARAPLSSAHLASTALLFARTLLPETEDTIIAEEVKKFPARK